MRNRLFAVICVLLALAMLPGGASAKAKKAPKKDIGIQLYSVRSLIGVFGKSQGDYKPVLKQLADMGYTSVEAASYKDGMLYGQTPEQFRKDVEDAGMRVISTHCTLNLSDEELAILDELNGLVLAGEIALERLQDAGNERIRNKNAEFGSQYELASYLYNYLSNNFRPEDIELRMGNIELLFKLSSRLKINSVKELEPVLKSVKFEKDRRNISQQIIDQMITGNEKRYHIYQELRAGQEGISVDERNAVEYFFSQWVPLEQLLNRVSSKNSPKVRGAFNINTLKRLNLLDKECINQIVSLRKIRNVLIHDIEIPEADYINRQGDEAQSLFHKLSEQFAAPA